jgi:glycosyltransferase involved in cell wall biosynthesis
MKILQVIPSFPPAYAFGGPVNVVYNVSKMLVKRGHEVVICTTDAKDFGSRIEGNPDGIDDGLEVHRFKNVSMTLVKKFKLFVTPQLALFLKKGLKRFDVLHLHEYVSFQNIVAYHYARSYGIPYILQAHGSLPRIGNWRRLKWIYDLFFGHRLLRDASKVIALSEVEAQQYRNIGVSDERITVIPNGIDLSEYEVLPPRGSFKGKFGIKDEEKIVLYLGRIHRDKGIDFLVKTFSYLIKNSVKNVRLVIAGPDDGYLIESKCLVNSLRLNEYILFTNMLSENDKIKAYVDSSVCAYLSPYEPFGLVSLEAAACGTPVIVSADTPMSQMVNDGGFGFSIKYGDLNQLVKMLQIILNNDNLKEEMGQRGRRFVFDHFDWSIIINKIEAVYNEALIVKKILMINKR